MLPNNDDFIKYYAGLAAEGETMLVVWQKPRRGAYVFPAFLADSWTKTGVAHYGNTGCFIMSRFAEGLPVSASSRNIEHVAVLICDDVGTKSKTPPIEPTWKIETSLGNYQWAYVFAVEHQPPKGEYCAAYNAIAAAGYTDPGANNPVRNFRLPGSVNLKEGRDNFAARLTEFNPEREFTLPQLVEAFGVTPGAAVREQSTITLADDGNDDVLAWLNAQGLVIAPINPAGWLGVVCPNAEAHTGAAIEGRYLPSSRAYKCLHAHCMAWDSERFLEWVEASGGPAHQSGLRSDLLASTMAGALAMLTPTAAFPDAAAAVVADVERRQLDRVEREELHARWAYIVSDDAYFDLQERQQLSRAAFNAIYRHLVCSVNGRRVEASVWFDANRKEKGGRTLDGVTYAAGETELCVQDGAVYGNRWRDARPRLRVARAPDIWLDHCARMLPERAEREHVFDVMAYKLQNPAVKINHAVLHAGRTGCGKDTMWAPFFEAIGGPARRNVALVSNETLNSQWGYDLESEVMIVNELRQTDGHDRRALENRLKGIIAAPPEFLPVNRKGLHPYMLANRGLVMAFSNARDAIALPSDDRRWLVLWTEADKLAPAAAARIWGWYKSGGFATVADWLYARDVSAFAPGAAPPMTEAKAILCEQSLNAAESFLVDLIRERRGDFAAGVIGGPFYSLLDRLAGSAPVGTKLYPAALYHALAEADWVDMGRIRAVGMGYKRVFCAANMRAVPKSDLRKMAEDAPPVGLALVKKPA